MSMHCIAATLSLRSTQLVHCGCFWFLAVAACAATSRPAEVDNAREPKRPSSRAGVEATASGAERAQANSADDAPPLTAAGRSADGSGAGGADALRDGVAGAAARSGPRSGNSCVPSSPNLEGCPCEEQGARRACWTGSSAKRNTGRCHDGMQICERGEEFGSWTSCVGEALDCGDVPDMPDAGECECIPGSVIHCDHDCTVGLFCVLTADKTCLPDGTWGPCRESARQLGSTGVMPLPDGGLPSPEQIAAMAIAAAQRTATECWSQWNGCEGSTLSPLGRGEQLSGDCAKHYSCGRPPANWTPVAVVPGAP